MDKVGNSTVSLYPDAYKNRPISLSRGKMAISDYFKATKINGGQLELMANYLEIGNQITVDFGDIDEQYYSSLELMFEKILETLRKQSTNVHEKYFSRLENVVSSVRIIGWSYYDHISYIFGEYEEETIDT